MAISASTIIDEFQLKGFIGKTLLRRFPAHHDPDKILPGSDDPLLFKSRKICGSSKLTLDYPEPDIPAWGAVSLRTGAYSSPSTLLL
jgi:hypothetical protein